MPLPTLLQKGKLVFSDPKDQDAYKNTIAIEYIISRLSTWENQTGISKRVLILESDTGSGKSTILPPMLYLQRIKDRSKRQIIVTQPRVANAEMIPRDQIVGSGNYPYMKLGENIGWQTRPTKKPPKFGVIYCTTGTLAEQVRVFTDEELLDKYQYIIIDEAHEISLELALLMYMLRNFYIRNANRRRLPILIITSATFDPVKYMKYFGVWVDPPADNFQQPCHIKVSGFAYPLKSHWDDTPAPATNYIKSAVRTALNIHEKFKDDPEDNRDILIFLPGMGEIASVKKQLDEENKKLAVGDKPVFMILSIDRVAINTNSADYKNLTREISSLKTRIAGKKYTPFRRIILSTVVFETGITIDTLRHVIDTGYMRGTEFHPIFGVSGLLDKPATKSRIMQRAGRSNRKSDGDFWPLYPKYLFDKLEKSQMSAIEQDDVSGIILQAITEHIKSRVLESVESPYTLDFAEIELLDKLDPDTIQYQTEVLYSLGFISPESHYEMAKIERPVDSPTIISEAPESSRSHFSITKLGHFASLFGGIEPKYIRILLAAPTWGASFNDLAIIISYAVNPKSSYRDDAIKQIDWGEVYKEGMPSYFNDTHSIYRARILTSDDFIDGLAIYRAVDRVAKRSYERGKLMKDVKGWCEKVNLKFNAVLMLFGEVDRVISQSLLNGLNVKYGENLIDVIEENFADAVARIKHCLYDGLRVHTAYYDSDINKYRSHLGYEIEVPANLTNDEITKLESKKFGITRAYKPSVIVFDEARLMIDQKTRAYKIKVDKSSAMDGYVDVDREFMY